MKKSVRIMIIIAIVMFIVLAILIGAIMLYLNRKKESITSSEFIEYMTSKNYKVSNVSNQINEDIGIKAAYTAIEKVANYQIRYYEFTDDNRAISFYNNSQSVYESSQNNKNTGYKNYSKFISLTNDRYVLISRISNTIIYTNTDSEHKDDVDAVFKGLNY